MTQIRTPRNAYLDCIRGFAIILVVLGHEIQTGSGSEFFQTEAFFQDPLFQMIYSFHMPLFIVLSGYLFAASVKNHSFSENIRTRFSKVLIPAAVWACAARLFPWIYNIWLYGAGNSKVDISSLPGNFVFWVLNDFWFLWSIFYCSIITLLINRYFKDSPVAYITIFVFLLFSNDFTFANHKYMFPYFVCAYFLGKYDVIKRINQIKLGKYILAIVCIGSGIAWYILLQKFNRDSFIYTTGNSLYKVERWGFTFTEQLLRISYRYCIGALGCIFVIGIVY